MSHETENIEARLAAYIDGEVTAAERAEIERHLQANPEHRQVIDDLLRQRQMLASLPHEAAPADVSESLQNHLERSALLGDREAPVELRIRRFPQVAAIAAMLILTIGLGMVVYLALPTSKAPSFTIAASHPTPPADEVTTEVFRSKGGEDAPKEMASAQVEKKLATEQAPAIESQAPVATASPAPGAASSAPSFALAKAADRSSIKKDAAGNMGKAAGGAAGDISNIFAQTGGALGQSSQKQASNVMFNSKTSANGPLVVVVSSDDPNRTQSEVTRYLDSNGIRWEPVVESMPAPLNLKNSQVALPSRFNQTRVRIAPQTAEVQQQQAARQMPQVAQDLQQRLLTNAPASQGSLQYTDAATPKSNSVAIADGLNLTSYNQGDNVIVCRDLTQEQAEQLSQSFADVSNSRGFYFDNEKRRADQPNLRLAQTAATQPEAAQVLTGVPAMQANQPATQLALTPTTDRAEIKDKNRESDADLTGTFIRAPVTSPAATYALAPQRELEHQLKQEAAPTSVPTITAPASPAATINISGLSDGAPTTAHAATTQPSDRINNGDVLLITVADQDKPQSGTIQRTPVVNEQITLNGGNLRASGLSTDDLAREVSKHLGTQSVTVRNLGVEAMNKTFATTPAEQAASQPSDRLDVVILVRNQAPTQTGAGTGPGGAASQPIAHPTAGPATTQNSTRPATAPAPF